ncbi:MAG: hypothetical protein AAGA87_14610 [Pseudomonadota bacterium]
MRQSDEAALIAAHAARDAPTLVQIYRAHAESLGDEDAAAFYMTQAYVWALEGGMPEARELHDWLKARGREA